MLEFDLSKTYGAFTLNLAATVGNEWLVLLAPSGAGKSLTLNLIAGMTKPDAGYVRLNGRTSSETAQGVTGPMRHRRIGYAFPGYALLPPTPTDPN